MLNIKRQILLNLLNNKNGLTSQAMATQLSVTPRTIRNNIAQLNDYFDQPIITYNKPHFVITDNKKVIDYIATKQNESHYPNYPHDRLFLTYFILYQKRQLKIDEITDYLHAGRNEVKKAIKELRNLLPKELELKSTKQGILLDGNILWLNYFLAKLATKRISRLINNQYLRLIFQEKISISEFKIYLKQLNTYIKSEYRLALNDRNLYILMIMHFLIKDDLRIQNDNIKFQTEFILSSHNRILQLSSVGQQIFNELITVAPQNKNYLYQLSGNIANHLQLLHQNAKYFKLVARKVTINGLVINCTNKDIESFKQLNKQNKAMKARIVLYDPDLAELAQYQDQFSVLTSLYPNLVIKATTNLFELNNLLHIKQQTVIFVAKKARLSLADVPYNIHYVHLDDHAYFTLIKLLLK